MPGPLLFIVFVIGIDILLKSVKDKKKIDQAKVKRAQENYREQANKPLRNDSPEKPKTLKDIRRILEEEIQKERQREIDRRQKSGLQQKVKEQKPLIEKPKEVKETFIKKEEIKDKSFENDKFKEDILRGLIFSEILSEPKALRKRNL